MTDHSRRGNVILGIIGLDSTLFHAQALVSQYPCSADRATTVIGAISFLRRPRVCLECESDPDYPRGPSGLVRYSLQP